MTPLGLLWLSLPTDVLFTVNPQPFQTLHHFFSCRICAYNYYENDTQNPCMFHKTVQIISRHPILFSSSFKILVAMVVEKVMELG